MYPFLEIEKKWAKKWLETGVYEPDLKTAKRPFYNLMMFPYPSAEGLHVGNVYAFTGSDIYGRYKRMQGEDVFEPIGLDGFGIHSENYALKIGTHPMKQSKISEKNFYRQLQMMGNGFAWNERLETYDPDYYKWTQWIFIQMFKNNLAYKKKSSVNWCPSCKTVLADEQVVNGECERCGTQVTKKELEQWFFRITKYVEKLLKNLDKIDWPEHIKIAQRNWIGRSEGALIGFGIKNYESGIKVFTTRPDTIYGATYMVLAPEHPLVTLFLKNTNDTPSNGARITNRKAVEDYIKKAKAKTDNERIMDAKSKTGIELKGVKAINPANKKEIPVWIADYVLASYGTGAIMAVPAHDQRDYEFAKKNNLPVREVISQFAKRKDKTILSGTFPTKIAYRQVYVGHGDLINSEEFTGMNSEEAKWKITKTIGGKKEVHYHLRDWLISRQRYWGPPIPMIYCKECDWQPVPDKDLPVLLPDIKNFKPTGTGESPLASEPKFYEVKCPACDGPARRETDVSDTFLDSAWYYLGYLTLGSQKSENKSQNLFSGQENRGKIKKWLPIDMYIGGAEHAVLHLLYMRFITMALKDMNYIDFEEPAPKLRTHGMLIKEGAKMSKSKGNVVNPDEYVSKFGADTLRMYLMFLGPLQDGGDWRDAGIMGVVRFLNRVWGLGQQMANGKSQMANGRSVSPLLHASIKKITDDISVLKYNTAIAELMTVLNRFEKEKNMSKKDFEVFLLMLAPFAPFITEELWEKLGNKYSIHKEPWPKYEEKYLVRDTINLIVQVNGKHRATFGVKKGITKKEAEKLALGEASVKRHIKSKPKKVVFVKDRLINFVV